MRATVVLLMTVIAATCGRPSLAQRQVSPAAVLEGRGDLINDVDRAAVALHPATPYIESSTLLLADLDLEKVDAEAIASWVQRLPVPIGEEQVAGMLRSFLDPLKAAGVERVYVTAATRSLTDGGPLVIIPCDNSTVVSGLAKAALQNLPPEPAQKVHVGEEIVIAGAAVAIDRVAKAEGEERPDLILPLKANDRLDHAIVLALPQQARRDLIALWPNRVPDEVPVKFSPRGIVQDVQRVMISWRLPPEPEMFVRIDCSDASGAERVRRVVDSSLALVGKVGSDVEVTVKLATVTLRASPGDFAKVIEMVAGPSRQRAQTLAKQNTMKQIGLAIHNYYDKEKRLPPRCYTDAQGKPLLSWRVALLPYLEQLAMYRAMKLDQPWDSEANRQFSDTRIPIYCDNPALAGKTTLRAPVYPGSMWHGEGPPKTFREVTDGTSATIAVIDAPESAAVEWANPEPWVLSEDDPMSDVFGDREAAIVLLLDGAVLRIKKSEMTNEKLKAMLTIAGGEAVER